VAEEKKVNNLINAGTKKKDVSPLYLAAHKGHTKSVIAIIENGGDLSKRDSSLGWSPLHACVSNPEHIETVKVLIDAIKKSKKPELINAPGLVHLQTPLMVSLCIEDGLPVAKLLLDAGASVLETDMDGNTSLHVISKLSAGAGLNDVLAAAEALKRKDLVTSENSLGLSPLDYARIALLKHALPEKGMNFSYFHSHQKVQKKEKKPEHTSFVFARELQKLASEGHLHRVATDPVLVRDMIERSLVHSNAAVEKAKRKAEQNKFQWHPYRDEDDDDFEDQDDNIGDFNMQVPDYDKYLEDHAPHEIRITYTSYDKPAKL